MCIQNIMKQLVNIFNPSVLLLMMYLRSLSVRRSISFWRLWCVCVLDPGLVLWSHAPAAHRWLFVNKKSLSESRTASKPPRDPRVNGSCSCNACQNTEQAWPPHLYTPHTWSSCFTSCLLHMLCYFSVINILLEFLFLFDFAKCSFYSFLLFVFWYFSTYLPIIYLTYLFYFR